jgi:chromosome segregation ATPase
LQAAARSLKDALEAARSAEERAAQEREAALRREADMREQLEETLRELRAARAGGDAAGEEDEDDADGGESPGAGALAEAQAQAARAAAQLAAAQEELDGAKETCAFLENRVAKLEAGAAALGAREAEMVAAAEEQAAHAQELQNRIDLLLGGSDSAHAVAEADRRVSSMGIALKASTSAELQLQQGLAHLQVAPADVSPSLLCDMFLLCAVSPPLCFPAP